MLVKETFRVNEIRNDVIKWFPKYSKLSFIESLIKGPHKVSSGSRLQTTRLINDPSN